MKALTIRQPWAWAIIAAGKTVENRRWRTNFRGTFAIHAAQAVRPEEYENFLEFHERISARPPSGNIVPPIEDFTLGAIVGVAELIDCTQETDDEWYFGAPGYAFLLGGVQRLAKPIPCKGKLKFFDLPDSVEREVLEQLEEK